MARLMNFGWKTYWTLVCAFMLTLAFVSISHAATFRGDAEVCASLGQAAGEVAGMRDAGVPWDAFGPWIKGALDEALQNPASYVKDAEDVAYIYGWFKRIYDEPGMNAAAAMLLMERDCMTKKMKGQA